MDTAACGALVGERACERAVAPPGVDHAKLASSSHMNDPSRDDATKINAPWPRDAGHVQHSACGPEGAAINSAPP